MTDKNSRKEERKKERRRERRRLRKAKAKEAQTGSFAAGFMQGEKPSTGIIKPRSKRLKKSSDAVQIGVLMPISDAGLEYIEKHDPELVVLIKEKNPRFRK